MQFKEVNVNELPQCDVLAYSYSGHKLIGKLKNMANIIVCVTHDTSLSNISHYLPLDEIKPSVNISKGVVFAISMTDGHSQRSRESGWRLGICDKPLLELFIDWANEKREEFAKEVNVPIEKIVTVSINCIQFT